MPDISMGFIGITGTLLGVAINELLRRQRRIEIYTARLFDKRLAAYEELTRKLHAGYEVATDIMESSGYSHEQRHEMISIALHDIASFTDENELYLDSDLAAHCVATFMGAEDVQDVKDENEKAKMKGDIVDMYVQARRMIRADSGVEKIDRFFKKLTKPTLSSPVIDYIKHLREHPEELELIREKASKR